MPFRNNREFTWFGVLCAAALFSTILLGMPACTPNSSSNSSTQSGTGGTGSYETHWKVSVVPSQKSMYQSVAATTNDIPATLNTTSVVITVTDPSGVPAPNGATVYLTCSNGAFGFRMISPGYNYAQPVTTDTKALNNGKAWVDFIAGFSPGVGAINATYQGVTATATIDIQFTPTQTTTTTATGTGEK